MTVRFFNSTKMRYENYDVPGDIATAFGLTEGQIVPWTMQQSVLLRISDRQMTAARDERRAIEDLVYWRSFHGTEGQNR